MAYLAFQDLGGAAAIRAAYQPEPATTEAAGEAAKLSALEWSVVALARRDRPSSLDKPGRIASAMRVLLGGHNPMLADPRLEALRRIAVLTWHHGYAVPTHELRQFLKAGFSALQYELVASSIGAARQRPPRTVIA